MDPRIISEVVFLGNFMMMLSKVLFLDLGASSTSQNSMFKEIKKPTPPLIPLTLDLCTKVNPGVTGQNIPPAGIYPGLKRPRLDYTRVYYGLGQFIPRGILWPRPIHTSSGQNIPS